MPGTGRDQRIHDRGGDIGDEQPAQLNHRTVRPAPRVMGRAKYRISSVITPLCRNDQL